MKYKAIVMWSLCFAILFGGQERPLAFPQEEDRAALRAVIERFFAAYQREDLAALISLWSEKSPGLEAARQSMKKSFAELEKIEVRNLDLVQLSVTADGAQARMRMELSANEAKTGGPAPHLGKANRTMRFVKEGAGWKIWGYEPSEEELAANLAAAQTEEARQSLLSENKELATGELVRALNRQGGRLLDQKKHAQALALYELALKLSAPLDDKEATAQSLRLIGGVYRARGNFAQSLDYEQRALKLAEEAGSQPETISALNYIASIHYAQGQHALALEYLQRGLALAEQTRDLAEMARILINIGLVHKSQNNYAQALEYYARSLKIADETNNGQAKANALVSMGSLYASQGDYTRALESLQRGLQVTDEIGDKAGASYALNNIGTIYRLQGDYAQALEYHRRALKVTEQTGDEATTANVLNNIGNVYYSQANYAAALDYYQQSLQVMEKLRNRPGIASSLTNIGLIHKSQGNDALALDYLQRSLRMKEEMGDRSGIANTLNAIGTLYTAQGNYAQALEFLQKSLQIREQLGGKAGIANVLSNLGLVYSDKGEHARSLDFFQRSLGLREQLGDKAGVANTLAHMAKSYLDAGRYAQAIESAEKSATLAQQIEQPEIFWDARTTAGMAYAAQGQPALARSAFLDAIAAIEKLRTQVAGGEQDQQRFFEDKVVPYYAMVQLSVEQNDAAQALDFAERAKSRVLLEVLSQGRLDINKAMSADELKHDRALTLKMASLNTQIERRRPQAKQDDAELVQLNKDLEKARLEYESFQTTLYVSHPELKVQRGHTQPLSLNEAGQLIRDEKTALLEYAVGQDKTYLFVLTKPAGRADVGQVPPTLKVYTLPVGGKELAKMSEEFLARVSERDLTVKEAARRLYQLLVQPAEKQLQGISKLCIVPDGPLWNLPFQALHTGSPEGYLLERYALFYAPSLSVLREMGRKGSRLRLMLGQRAVNAGHASSARPASSINNGGPELLALGNPLLGEAAVSRLKAINRDEPLTPLPEAEREVRTLGQLYGPTHSTVLVGEQAREEIVKAEAGKYAVLHFATHSVLDNRNPMYSRIMLSRAAGDSTEDGILEAWEILKLNLDTEIVVMSACQTARGRVGAGEGMIGMSWALFVAGCPAAVVSQWKVDSARTAELMVQFHQNLLRKGTRNRRAMTKSEALREASLKLLRGPYNHPAYWAGFILIGDER